MAQIEIMEPINATTVERAWRRITIMSRARDDRLARQGLRAAIARDAKMLLALDKGATVMRGLSESQFGHAGQQVGELRIPATEYQLWRNAYTAADKTYGDEAERREVLAPYENVYAMAGLLAGVIY